MQKTKVTISILLVVVTGAAAIGDTPSVAYPSSYRNWQHVKSMIIEPSHSLADPFEGIHHVYGNAKAMQGLAAGQYKRGAVFVFDLLAIEEVDATVAEADRKRIDVMEYDAERFAETGGWGFVTFVGDSTTERLEQDVVTACYACHVAAKPSAYVFSKYRK